MRMDQSVKQDANKQPSNRPLLAVFISSGLGIFVFAAIIFFLQFDDPSWREFSVKLVIFGVGPAMGMLSAFWAIDRWKSAQADKRS